MKKDKERKTIFKKKGQPNLFSDGLMTKVTTILIETQVTGTAINRRIVMAIGNGVVRSNSSTLLERNGGRWSKRKIGRKCVEIYELD